MQKKYIRHTASRMRTYCIMHINCCEVRVYIT